MTAQDQIEAYIAAQPSPKRQEMEALHQRILRISPDARLWFLDGRDALGRIVSNPNIGYGLRSIRYASGETRDFYRVGLSANTAGISVYIMDTEDKRYLSQTYGDRLGKAKVSGYCIKFRSLSDTNLDVLEEIITDCMARAPA